MGRTEQFYQEEYSEGFTTDCPSDEALSGLLSQNFLNSAKDFTAYVNVLRMLGLQPGASVLDFGSSWGYGSWQMREAGFRVYSYEVSKPRARYAAVKLACEMLGSLDKLPAAMDCLFSAHVIEHLPNPNLLWELADRVLSPDGLLVCFCPNGSPHLESVYGLHRYDQIWGKVHPLLITPDFLTGASGRHGFVCSVHSTPFAGVSRPPGRQSADGLLGAELLMVAQRRAPGAHLHQASMVR